MSPSRPNIILLGTFVPSKLHEVIIASEMQAWLASVGITSSKLWGQGKLPIAVRNPEDNALAASRTPLITRWHRDGAGEYAEDEDYIPETEWIIVWSNGTATQLMDESGVQYCSFATFDVILFNNRIVRHRTPLPIEPNRWHARLLDPILPL